MVLLTAAATAGAYHTNAKITQENKLTGAGTDYAVGTLVFLDVADDMWKPTPAAAATRGPFGIVVNKKPLTTDTKMEIAQGGEVIMIADGAIAPGNFVMPSAATIGQVIEYAASAIGAADTANIGTARDEFRRIVGRYRGKANGNSRDGILVTAAADNDLIWVEFGLGTGGV